VRRALPWLVRARISRLTGDAEGARDAALAAAAGAAGSDPFMGLLAAREGLLIDGQLQADGMSYSMLMWQQFQTQRKEFVAAHRASIELDRLERQHTEIAQARAALESALVSALAEEEVLQRAANSDPLTGLLNRRAFTRSLANSLSWRDSVSPMAVAFIDLDDFKGINDLHGHSVGDDVLRFVADRLTSCIREGDLLARFGGDEFVALVQVPQDGRSLDEWGLRVLATLAVPSTIGGVEWRVSASVGMCIVDPRRLPDVEEIIRQADAAMYAAKGRGAGSVEVRRMG
jgi:diguanylate cyclase (GGDEF)-like protein